MRKLLTTICLSLMSAAVFAQDSGALAKALIDKAASIISIDCDFTQTRHVSIMDGDMVSKGHMAYAAPDHLEWTYTSPNPMGLVLDGETVTINSAGKSSTADTRQNRMYREISRLLMGSISGSALTDSRTFETTVTRDKGFIVAELVPKKAELKRMWSKMTMYFTASTMTADRIEILEAGGDTTTIVFTNIRTK